MTWALRYCYGHTLLTLECLPGFPNGDLNASKMGTYLQSYMLGKTQAISKIQSEEYQKYDFEIAMVLPSKCNTPSAYEPFLSIEVTTLVYNII